MNRSVISASILLAVVAGTFSGSVSAQYDCTACMRNYLNCIQQGPGNPAQQAICDHEYAGCLAQCDGLEAAQVKSPFKDEDTLQFKQSPSQVASWLDRRS